MSVELSASIIFYPRFLTIVHIGFRFQEAPISFDSRKLHSSMCVGLSYLGSTLQAGGRNVDQKTKDLAVSFVSRFVPQKMNGSGEPWRTCLAWQSKLVVNKKSPRLSKADWFRGFFVNLQRGPEPTAMLVMEYVNPLSASEQNQKKN